MQLLRFQVMASISEHQINKSLNARHFQKQKSSVGKKESDARLQPGPQDAWPWPSVAEMLGVRHGRLKSVEHLAQQLTNVRNLEVVAGSK